MRTSAFSIASLMADGWTVGLRVISFETPLTPGMKHTASLAAVRWNSQFTWPLSVTQPFVHGGLDVGRHPDVRLEGGDGRLGDLGVGPGVHAR